MKRGRILLLTALIIANTALLRAEEPVPDTSGLPTYLIECRIATADILGDDMVISAPHITVYENQAASLRDTTRLQRPGKTKKIEWLEEGTAIDVRIFRAEDGQQFLDATLQCTGHPQRHPLKGESAIERFLHLLPDWIHEPQEEAKPGIRLVMCGARIVEPVQLDKWISVPLNGFGKSRFDVRVSHVDKTKDDKPTDDESGLILGGVTPRVIIQEEERLGIHADP